MIRTTCITLAACLAGGVFAQSPARPDPADRTPAAPARPAYESAFKGYRPYADPEVARWRESNEEMGRLRGHVGHVPGSVPRAGAAPASKSGPAGHGGDK